VLFGFSSFSVKLVEKFEIEGEAKIGVFFEKPLS
jgi:hypothetical protein